MFGIGDLTTKFQAFIEFRAVDKLSKTLREIKDLSEKTKTAFKGLYSASVNLLYAGGRLALWMGGLTAPLGVALKEAIEFERVLVGEFNKVVGASGEELSRFSSFFTELSERIPLTATEIARLSANLAQMGVPTDQLREFTRMVAEASFAFDVMAEEAGRAFGEIRNAFGIRTVNELRSVGDAINYLSNTMGAAAGEIVSMLARVGAAAKNLGLAAESTAVFAATIREAGYAPELVSSALSVLFMRLSTMDDKLTSVLGTVGLSAEAFRKLMKESPEKAILRLLEALRALNKEARSRALKELVGTEHFSKIMVLVNNYEKLRTKLGEIEAGEHLGSMSEEVEALLQTTSAQLTLFMNKIKNLGIAIGSVLLPPFNAFLSVLDAIVTPVARFVSAHKTLTTAIFMPFFAISGLLFVLGALALTLGLLGKALVRGTLAIRDMGKALFVLRAAVEDQIVALKAFRDVAKTFYENRRELLLWIKTGETSNALIKHLDEALVPLKYKILELITPLRVATKAFIRGALSINTYKVAALSLIKVLNRVAAGFRLVLAASLRFAFSPVGLVLTGVSVLLYGVVANVERLKGALLGLWDSFKTFVFLERLQPLWEGFKIGLLWAEDGIKDLKSVIKPLSDALKGIVEAIFGIRMAAGEFDGGAFKNWLEAGIILGRAFAQVLNTVAEVAAVFLKPLVNGLALVISLVARLIKWFKSVSDNPLIQVGISVASLTIPFLGLFRLIKLVRAGFVGVRFAVLGVVYALGLVVEAAGWLKDRVGAAFSRISEVLVRAGATIGGVITTTFTQTFSTIRTHWAKLRSLFDGALDRLRERVVAVFVALRGPAQAAATAIVKALLAPIFVLSGKIQDLWSGLRGVVAKIFALFKELAEKLVTPLREINLFEIGRNIISGLVEGMKSIMSAPVDVVKRIGSGIVDGFKRLLGIQSPSRVFAQLGYFIVQGLTQGLRTDAPAKELIKLAKNLVDVFSSLPRLRLGLEVAPAIGKVSVTGTEAGSWAKWQPVPKPSTGKAKTVIINKVVDRMEIVINGEVKGTPKEIAKEVGEEMERRLSDLLFRLV